MTAPVTIPKIRVKPESRDAIETLRTTLEDDPRIDVDIFDEREFYS